VGIAAAVLAFVGFVFQQVDSGSSEDTSATGGSAPREAAPQPAAAGDLALPDGSTQILASGLDYNKDTLGQVGVSAMTAAEPPTNESGGSLKSSQPRSTGRAESEGALGRLGVQQALLACIDAISEQNGAGAVTAQTVDFARFNGAPALIVQFTAGNGTWVWATGAECGTPAGDADKLAAVKVG